MVLQSSQLCAEKPDKLSSTRFKQTKSYLHVLALFSPPRDATKLSLHWIDQELLDPYLQASASTERAGSPCCQVLLSLWVGHTIMMVTQAKKLMKTEVQLLKSPQPQWNSKLNTCTKVPLKYGSLLCEIKPWNPLPLVHSSFYTLSILI